MRREKDKKEQWREKQRQRREERVRGSNARERRGWTETRETTKRAAELNCLCGSRHFVFIYFTHNFIVGLRFFFLILMVLSFFFFFCFIRLSIERRLGL